MEIEGAIYPSLKGKTVFVTGGGSGIGASIVEHFCAQSCRVAFVDVVEEPSKALVAAVTAKGHARPEFIRCDLRDTESLQTIVEGVGREVGPIRVLVNNAGNDDRHHFSKVTRDYWDDRVAVNLRHQFFAAQAVHPQMKSAGGGSIDRKSVV